MWEFQADFIHLLFFFYYDSPHRNRSSDFFSPLFFFFRSLLPLLLLSSSLFVGAFSFLWRLVRVSVNRTERGKNGNAAFLLLLLLRLVISVTDLPASFHRWSHVKTVDRAQLHFIVSLFFQSLVFLLPSVAGQAASILFLGFWGWQLSCNFANRPLAASEK